MPSPHSINGPGGPVNACAEERGFKTDLLDGYIETRDISAGTFEQTLKAISCRIDAISRQGAISSRDFVELTALFNNATYILLYLDANAAHIEVDFLEHHRQALSARNTRDERLSTLIRELKVESEELEIAQAAFLAHFTRETTAAECDENKAVSKLRREGVRWRETLDRDKTALLSRLGVTVGVSRPDAALYALLSGQASVDLRRRISMAWRAVTERHDGALCESIDILVAARRKSAIAQGMSSVTNRTLRESRLDEAKVYEFLDRSIKMARAEHDALERTLKDSFGPGGVAANFPSFVAMTRAGETPPTIPLEPCINFALSIARAHFKLQARRVANAPAHMITYDMWQGENRIGRINFDLWGGHLGRTANTTNGLRNRAEWNDITQQPVAHISCRFKNRQGEEPTINFQNAHSLLHEFGHALNHLLVRPRLPNLSGLEYLPLERIEILSMWFERWVFHPAFEQALNVGRSDRLSLATSREIKRLEYLRTHLERNVLAILDFELHSGHAPIAQVYSDLDQRYGLADHCPLSDVLPCFFWPILTERPGGYFSYLWAAAASAQRFEPIQAIKGERAITESSSDTVSVFRDCFEFDAPSTMPDLRALYRFYDVPGAITEAGDIA